MKDLRALMTQLGSSHGVVDTPGIAAAGLSRHDLRELTSLGVLDRVAPGTYVCRGARDDYLQRAMAAVCTVRHGAEDDKREMVALARKSAAWLWGLTDQRCEPRMVQLVVPHGRSPSPDHPGIRVHRSRTLTAEDVTEVNGVPVTTATRTVVDSAINMAVADLRELVARGLQLEVFDLEALSEQLARAGRIHGGARLSRALCEIDPDVALAESRGERAGFEALRRAGFEPVRQHPLAIADRNYRLDIALVLLRIAVEIDGYWWHSTPARRAADLRRQNDLISAGWRVLRFGAAEVVRDPEVIVVAVRAAILGA